MFTHLNTRLGQLRLISFTEGVSYVLLFFIAMPLKYFFGKPEAVSLAGSIHGFLFVIFFVSLVLTAMQRRWPLKRALLCFVAAILPLGAFFFDRSIKREIEETLGQGSG